MSFDKNSVVESMQQLSDALIERNMLFWGDFGRAFLANSTGVFVVGEPLCDVGTPS